MSVTTIEAVIENNQIRLPHGVLLPENAKVYILIPDSNVPPVTYIGSPRLRHPAQISDFQKEVVEESYDGGV